MNKILEKYFVKKYPKIFRDMYGPRNKTSFHWGIETGDGWWFLLNNLCSKIQSHIDNPPWVLKNDNSGEYEKPKHSICKQVVALQIKEKLGGLRFYYSGGGDDYIKGLVDFAESLSYNICENCGKFNEEVGRTQGWIQSLCPSCASEYGKEIKQNDNLLLLWNKVMLNRSNPKRSWETIDEVSLDDIVKEFKKDWVKTKKRKK